jgi:AbiV family abortive infection protein
MCKASSVSERTLVEGHWYAMEQAGRLVTAAVRTFDNGDFATALALAMFAREELGRSRILLELSTQVRAGAVIAVAKVREETKDHLEKQKRGYLSHVIRAQRGDPFDRLFLQEAQAPLGTPAWRKIRHAIDRRIARWAQAIPKRRHTERLEALYLELGDDGKSWSRPINWDQQHAREAVHDAANDYSVARSNVQDAILQNPQIMSLAPDRKMLLPWKPADVNLPAAVWPA